MPASKLHAMCKSIYEYKFAGVVKSTNLDLYRILDKYSYTLVMNNHVQSKNEVYDSATYSGQYSFAFFNLASFA